MEERGNLGRGGELTTGEGDDLSGAEKRVEINQSEEKEKEREGGITWGTTARVAQREGSLNYGMFQVITDSNNYLQLLCTFSFQTWNYDVIMWIIHRCFTARTEEKRRGGRTWSRGNQKNWENWPSSSSPRPPRFSIINSHWPSIMGDWMVNKKKIN